MAPGSLDVGAVSVAVGVGVGVGALLAATTTKGGPRADRLGSDFREAGARTSRRQLPLRLGQTRATPLDSALDSGREASRFDFSNTSSPTTSQQHE